MLNAGDLVVSKTGKLYRVLAYDKARSTQSRSFYRLERHSDKKEMAKSFQWWADFWLVPDTVDEALVEGDAERATELAVRQWYPLSAEDAEGADGAEAGEEGEEDEEDEEDAKAFPGGEVNVAAVWDDDEEPKGVVAEQDTPQKKSKNKKSKKKKSKKKKTPIGAPSWVPRDGKWSSVRGPSPVAKKALVLDKVEHDAKPPPACAAPKRKVCFATRKLAGGTE